MRACVAPAGRTGARRGGEGTPERAGRASTRLGDSAHSYGLEQLGEKQSLDVSWVLAVLSSIFCLRLFKRSVRAVTLGSKLRATPLGRWVRPG